MARTPGGQGAPREVGAAQNVSLGVASHQLLVAMALRQRLARVAEVFATGAIGLRMVTAIAHRTALITDPDAQRKVDLHIAAACREWGSLSVAKIETAIHLDRGQLERAGLTIGGQQEADASTKPMAGQCVPTTEVQ